VTPVTGKKIGAIVESVALAPISVPPQIALGVKVFKVKLRVVATPWKGTIPPLSVKAIPDKVPASLPVSPTLAVPLLSTSLNAPPVGVNFAEVVVPMAVSSCSARTAASNRVTLPAAPVLGTKKAASPEAVPPVTAT
jgi:hypothetical protein